MAKKINGEHGAILARIDMLEEHSREARTTINEKLDLIARDMSQVKIDVNGIGIKAQSIQNELTEHKKNHWQWFTTLFTGGGLIGILWKKIF